MAARLLKKTGEAIKHSPGALRRALSGGNRDSYELALEEAKDPFKVGLSFYVTYIGFEKIVAVSTADQELVRKVDGIVNRILTAPRTTPAKRLVLVVNDKRISVTDRRDALSVVRIPLYAIAYAGSHPLHDSVFVFLETKETEFTTCHIMLCESAKMAKTLVRVAAKAFQNAYLDWQAQTKRGRSGSGGRELDTRTKGALDINTTDDIPNNMIIARSGDSASASSGTAGTSEPELSPPVVEEGSVDGDTAADETADGEEEKVERLARHRSFYRRSCVITNPDVLDTGLLGVKPDDFDFDEAKEFVKTVEIDTVTGDE